MLADPSETCFLHVVFELFYVFFSASRRNIAAVEETVYAEVFDAFFFCHVYDGEKVIYMAVHAAV